MPLKFRFSEKAFKEKLNFNRLSPAKTAYPAYPPPTPLALQKKITAQRKLENVT
jgi:hypothetical protein